MVATVVRPLTRRLAVAWAKSAAPTTHAIQETVSTTFAATAVLPEKLAALAVFAPRATYAAATTMEFARPAVVPVSLVARRVPAKVAAAASATYVPEKDRPVRKWAAHAAPEVAAIVERREKPAAVPVTSARPGLWCAATAPPARSVAALGKLVVPTKLVAVDWPAEIPMPVRSAAVPVRFVVPVIPAATARPAPTESVSLVVAPVKPAALVIAATAAAATSETTPVWRRAPAVASASAPQADSARPADFRAKPAVPGIVVWAVVAAIPDPASLLEVTS